MTDAHADAVLPQLVKLIHTFEVIQRRTGFDDFHNIPLSEASQFVSAGIAAVCRATGEDSEYARQVARLVQPIRPDQLQLAIPIVAGTVKAVREAIASGYLIGVRQLIHAEVFGDFLEMANHLVHDGYKDPAAVLIGGVLEDHLRKLCDKNGLPTEFVDSSGKPRPKKVETMNTELAKAGVYLKTDQKMVTGWYGLRTDAAHGHYDRYSAEQVRLMLDGVTNFLARHPA